MIPIRNFLFILLFVIPFGSCLAQAELPLNHSPLDQLPLTTTDNSILPPPELNLPVTFYPQAPLGQWKLPWQEACEEASALTAANFYFLYNWDREQFNDQILNLIAWEKANFGTYIDTSVAQTVYFLKAVLGLDSVIHDDPGYYQVKTILAQGHLIIFPLAGRELQNPNYQNGGPRYHMIVLKGYTADGKIITNDVGTEKGADYLYDWETLQHANHDLASPIDDGAKKMIEVLPPPEPNL